MDEYPNEELPNNTGLYLLSFTSFIILLVWFVAGKWA